MKRRRFKYPLYSGGREIIYRLRIPAREIGYFSATLEAYDGVGLCRTIDEERGVIEVWVPPDRQKEIEEVLKGIEREIPIERLTDNG